MDRRLGGPQSRSGWHGEVKVLDLTGTRIPTLSCPARSQSLLIIRNDSSNRNWIRKCFLQNLHGLHENAWWLKHITFVLSILLDIKANINCSLNKHNVITIIILYIIHCPVFHLKHNVSETGFRLNLQVELTQLNPTDTGHRQSKSKSKSHYDRRSVGQFVLVSCPFWSRWSGVTFIWVTIIFFIFHVWRPLWREDGSVISSAMTQVQWELTFSAPWIPTHVRTKLYIHALNVFVLIEL
jgi:hypothetical protein